MYPWGTKIRAEVNDVTMSSKHAKASLARPDLLKTSEEISQLFRPRNDLYLKYVRGQCTDFDA